MHTAKPPIVCILLWFCFLSAVPAMAQGGSGSQHYFFIGTESGTSHIYQFYVGSASGTQDVTAAANAPVPASGSKLTGFADATGEHVLYLGTNGHVYQLFSNSYTSGSWVAQDLTSETGGTLAASGSALTSFSDSTGEHLLYLGSNQHVYQLYFGSDDVWTEQDLTSLSGGVLAASGSALTSFSDGTGEHLLYLGSNQHVYQLYFGSDDVWTEQDLTSLSDGAVAASGSSLASFSDQAGEHVPYVGTNNHVYQLFHNGSSWANQDITQEAPFAGSSLLAATGTPLSSFSDSNGEHLYFISSVETAPGGCSDIPAGALYEFFYDFANGGYLPGNWYSLAINTYTATGSAITSLGSTCSSSTVCQNIADVYAGQLQVDSTSLYQAGQCGYLGGETIGATYTIYYAGGDVSPSPLASFVDP